MIYNIYTISLERTSLLFETGRPRYLVRFGAYPGRFLNGQFEKFKVEFNKLFNQNKTINELSMGMTLMKMYNRAYNLLPALQKAILYTDETDRSFEIYKRYFGKEMKTIQDYNHIQAEIDRLKTKIKEMQASNKKDEGDGSDFSFEKIISNVETILGQPIDRKMKLYAFKHKYDTALKRAKDYEKNKVKRG